MLLIVSYRRRNVTSIGILRKVLDEAEKSTVYPHRVGAIVFRGKRILGVGHNSNSLCSLHPKYVRYNESVHAEQAAISSLDWSKLRGASILVIRLTRRGKLAMSKPCAMCQALIEHVKIKKVYYSNSYGEIVMEKI
jgi:deoxycytidylate deaminase